MQPSFHYVLKAKLIRLNENNEINFLEIEEKFENESPILARENVFNHYQNYIDVFLQWKGITYISDLQAREELKSFIDPGKSEKIIIGETEVDFSESLFNGIGIFLKINNPIEGNFYEEKFGDEIFIHGIGYSHFLINDSERMISGLEREFAYYTHFKYKTNNKEKQVVYCNRDEWEEGYTENEPFTYTILETPFDFTDYAVPHWWGNGEEEEKDLNQVPKTLEEIINGGESNQIEFKPTLLYNFLSGKGGIGIKAIIAKTICAFLNSNGGLLLIGLSDNGNIQGLDFDFSLSNEKNPKDFFRLEFDQMLEYFLSFSVKSNVQGEFFEKDEKHIFIVTVTPSKHRPIFLKGQFGKEFYVRGEASSRQLIDPEELSNYCIERWSNTE